MTKPAASEFNPFNCPIFSQRQHIGLISGDELPMSAKCRCGFKTEEFPYPYQAKEALFKHFRERGTMKDDWEE